MLGIEVNSSKLYNNLYLTTLFSYHFTVKSESLNQAFNQLDYEDSHSLTRLLLKLSTIQLYSLLERLYMI